MSPRRARLGHQRPGQGAGGAGGLESVPRGPGLSSGCESQGSLNVEWLQACSRVGTLALQES